MKTKLITKSFERLLEKGLHRGFITYEELGKSLGKRNSSNENLEKALIILFDKKVTLVSKKSEFQSQKKKEANQTDADKTTEKSDDPIRMYLREMGGVENIQYMDGVKIGVLTGSLLSTLFGYFLILLTPNKPNK